MKRKALIFLLLIFPFHIHAQQTSIKLSLNAYSFNAQLTSGTMTLDDLLAFSAEKGFSAVHLTAYYFPGYPKVPSDEFLYNVKRKAFRLGLEISGTGVRNDFTEADPVKRRENVELVKNWVIAAEKLGAPVLRIFAGNQTPTAQTREQILASMVADIKECVAFGQAHGVMITFQNHFDFIKTGAEVTQLMTAIHSDWFGFMLDTGGFRTGDPYAEIATTAPFAVNWQVKENVFIDGKEVPLDTDKLIGIIKASGYSGYIALETLGDGDPKVKLVTLAERVKRSLLMK